MLNISDAENVGQSYTKARNKVMIRKSKGEFKKNIGGQSKSNTEIFLI